MVSHMHLGQQTLQPIRILATLPVIAIGGRDIAYPMHKLDAEMYAWGAYDTSVDAVADSYFQFGGNFLFCCIA